MKQMVKLIDNTLLELFGWNSVDASPSLYSSKKVQGLFLFFDRHSLGLI